MSKVFIIGLPRTGTTSICAIFLELGYKVAHTAYTKACIETADVIADTPIYCDYPQLDKLFPHSKFIYLERSQEDWLPSISALLKKLTPHLEQTDGGYNPILRRCYHDVFNPLTSNTRTNDIHLHHCYVQHREKAQYYFQHRENDILFLDIGKEKSMQRLLTFIGKPSIDLKSFPRLNSNGKINAWQDLKHPLKVDSYTFGPDRRRYYDFK